MPPTRAPFAFWFCLINVPRTCCCWCCSSVEVAVLPTASCVQRAPSQSQRQSAKRHMPLHMFMPRKCHQESTGLYCENGNKIISRCLHALRKLRGPRVSRASRGPGGPARGSEIACGHGVRMRGDMVRSCPSGGLAASLYRAFTPESPLVDAVARQSPSPGVRAPRGEERTKRARVLNDAANASFVVHQLWM